LQGKDFYLLDRLDRLVIGQRLQIERSAGRQFERIDASATGNSAACGQCALQAGAGGGDGIAAAQRVEDAACVGEAVRVGRSTIERATRRN
jgi:hypothetical protein